MMIMHSLYKKYSEIWSARLSELRTNTDLLSESSRSTIKDIIKRSDEKINQLTLTPNEGKEERKILQDSTANYRQLVSRSDVIQKEIDYLEHRMASDPLVNEFYMPTQIKVGPLLGLKTIEIPTEYQHDPSKTFSQNAEASVKAWLKLKKYLQQTYREGTWKLAACSTVGYVYSQEFTYEI